MKNAVFMAGVVALALLLSSSAGRAESAIWVRFADSISVQGAVTLNEPKTKTVKGREGQVALQLDEQGLLCKAPESHDWSRGSLSFWLRPDSPCRDDQYRRFFDIGGKKSRLYFHKSGKGGGNGLFLCIADDAGTMRMAHAIVGRDYQWKPGEWHRLGASWDASRGLFAIYFDGKRVARKTIEPFALDSLSGSFAIGTTREGTQPAQATFADFRIHSEPELSDPAPSAHNWRNAETCPWKLIDGDASDNGAWTGMGAPNWVEIRLPKPISLARVTVHPGILRNAPYPSTECSPKTYVIEGWKNGAWQPLSSPVSVPLFTGGKEHRVTTEISPFRTQRFRLSISQIHDGGKRLSSPEIPIVPPEERTVAIREIEWSSAEDVAREEKEKEALVQSLLAEVAQWRTQMASSSPLAFPLRSCYAERFREIERLASSGTADGRLRAEKIARHLRLQLAPWCQLPKSITPSAEDGVAGHLDIQVDCRKGVHDFYPARLPVDLDFLGKLWKTSLDPLRIRVVALDRNARQPSRLDRVTPTRGTLVWTIPPGNDGRFRVFFSARTDAPPPRAPRKTLGDCDPIYYANDHSSLLPGNLWSLASPDLDRDGNPDLLAGRWTDFAHFWRNQGTGAQPKFHESDYWLLRDEFDVPLAASENHHGLAFSVIHPSDLDGDGATDVLVTNYYGKVPMYHRNLSTKGGFPVFAEGIPVEGLGKGRLALGELTGDGQVDAVLLHRAGDDKLMLYEGLPFKLGEAPCFRKLREINVHLGREPFSSARSVPSLADTDGDGDLDLFVYTAPYLYRHENTGTASTPVFAPQGEAVKIQSQALQASYYYPYMGWGDADGDGDLDLLRATGAFLYTNEGTRAKLRLSKAKRPVWTRQQRMGRAGLKAFDLFDWDGDGDLDHLRLGSRGLDLVLTEMEDGRLLSSSTIPVDPNKRDWHGCPDPTEYYALYGNVKLVDWDGDGNADLFCTSEHSWRYGYIHYYKRKGDGTFAPEIRMRPDPACDYVQFVPGKQGKGAHVTGKTFLDYLSVPTAGNFDPEEGEIRFWFRPDWDPGARERHVLIHTSQHPDTYGIAAGDLKMHYIGRKSDLALRPPFELAHTEKGTLCFRAWEQSVETEPLKGKAGIWLEIVCRWGAIGMELQVDGRTLAFSKVPIKAGVPGRRLYLGANDTYLVQREREYPGRWSLHPKVSIFPAAGTIDELRITGKGDTSLLHLSFDGHCDGADGETGQRSRVGYRCTPGFADFTGDGKLDMVMMMSDGRRGAGSKGEQRQWGKGRLMLFPNKDGALGKGVLLRHVDGSPFACHIRTQITCTDWDEDGRMDLILSTENYGSGPNRMVDFFRNAGTDAAGMPQFAAREPMKRLNELITPHHEVKLCAVDWTGNGKTDIVTSTDPGTRVTVRSFLDALPPTVKVVAVSQARH